MTQFSLKDGKLRDLIAEKRQHAAAHLDTEPEQSLTAADELMHLGDFEGDTYDFFEFATRIGHPSSLERFIERSES